LMLCELDEKQIKMSSERVLVSRHADMGRPDG
jgi:hypothetical protein